MNKHTGVTLLELMITVSILGVLLVSGLKMFDSEMSSQTLNDASQQIASTVKQARYYAKSTGDETKIIFTNQTGTYSIRTDNDNKAITKDNYNGGLSGQLPENINVITSNCGILYFSVDGTILDNNKQALTRRCTVKIGYNNGPQQSLDIQPGIGNVVYE